MKGKNFMKRFLAILMAISMLAVFAGCDPIHGDSTGGSNNPGATEGFSYTLAGVKLTPGAAFPKDQLPEPASVYTVPSCAIEGMDNVYNYTTVEVTAFQDSNGEVIYSIFILDANTPTPEGLFIGDALSQAEALYGTDYQRQDNQITYTKGNTLLVMLLQNDFINTIEYRLAT